MNSQTILQLNNQDLKKSVSKNARALYQRFSQKHPMNVENRNPILFCYGFHGITLTDLKDKIPLQLQSSDDLLLGYGLGGHFQLANQLLNEVKSAGSPFVIHQSDKYLLSQAYAMGGHLSQLSQLVEKNTHDFNFADIANIVKTVQKAGHLQKIENILDFMAMTNHAGLSTTIAAFASINPFEASLQGPNRSNLYEKHRYTMSWVIYTSQTMKKFQFNTDEIMKWQQLKHGERLFICMWSVFFTDLNNYFFPQNFPNELILKIYGYLTGRNNDKLEDILTYAHKIRFATIKSALLADLKTKSKKSAWSSFWNKGEVTQEDRIKGLIPFCNHAETANELLDVLVRKNTERNGLAPVVEKHIDRLQRKF